MNRIETINAIVEQGFSGGEWCATNKIHGANYSFWQDDDDLRSAKRSGLMDGDGGGFYGSHTVYAKYSVTMRQMFHDFKSQFNFDYMVAYGELFGGSYPHPEVDRVPQASKVQDGVSYCPHNDFYMFDIAFYLEGKLLFYSSKTAVGYTAEKFGIPAANIMAKGTFKEMTALNPIFEDPLYKFFGLPKIEGNMSEGLVISPVDTKFFTGGSRVILKNKNPNFSEQKAKKERKPPKELDPEVAILLDEGFTYVSENRLRNVLSHGHDLSQKDFGKLMGLMAEDVFIAFSKDHGNELTCLEKKNKKLVNAALNREIAALIKPNWQNILDGNF